MARRIASRTSLDNLKREAKRWLKALRAKNTTAWRRFVAVVPNAPASPTLRDVQHALALEHGLPRWDALKDCVEKGATKREYEKVAEALVAAYRTGDETAMRTVRNYFGHMRAWETMRRYVRLDLGMCEIPQAGEDETITLTQAQYLVARFQGFNSWDDLVAFASSVSRVETTVIAKSLAAYSSENHDRPAIVCESRDWDEVLGIIKDRQLPGLDARGQMTDAMLERVGRFNHLTMLQLSGSKALSDNGIRHIARLRRLRHLNLMGCDITDRALEVLQRLPALETLDLSWTHITDAGAAHLAKCPNLQKVNLMETACGDGAIRALAGKRALRDFRSGNGVTDAGLPSLHDLPMFKRWHGGDPNMALLRFDAGPTFLMLRGSFTDRGLATLDGLEGLFALNVDDARLGITGKGLVALAALPHFGWLAFDAKDESMPYIAALPQLRFLMCQDTTARDEGFVALSQSQSLQYLWGRRCYGLSRRGFSALADMPALRAVSVSCKNVDDRGLSALPRFPALRELMPIDVPDNGYRHIGQCHQLESLLLMYCRETTDTATEHIATLHALRKYFASYNRITDRTPQILSGMTSLEDITFASCAGLTDAGITTLARLPRLRALRLESMPHVSRRVLTAFSANVRVDYTT